MHMHMHTLRLEHLPSLTNKIAKRKGYTQARLYLNGR
jgi:hypothetical protein